MPLFCGACHSLTGFIISYVFLGGQVCVCVVLVRGSGGHVLCPGKLHVSSAPSPEPPPPGMQGIRVWYQLPEGETTDFLL